MAVSRKLVDLWSNFARTGAPTQEGAWSPVDKDRTEERIQYAVIDSKEVCRMFLVTARFLNFDDFTKSAVMKGCPKATSSQMNRFLKLLR